MTGRKIRRLFWDIETSPDVVFSWRAGHKITIDPESILKERAIICIAWKWEDEDEVHCLTWDHRQNDRAMLKAFLAVAAEADELVAHNGDRFDIAWFRTRCLFHGLPTLPAFKTVDTLKWAKGLYYFNSNRLDYIAKFLGLERKHKTGRALWHRVVLDNDREALVQMVEYCKQDVLVLQQVWTKLRLSARPATHAGVLAGEANWSCPHCGSTNVRKSKTRVSAAGVASHQMRCNGCHGFYTISTSAYKRYSES